MCITDIIGDCSGEQEGKLRYNTKVAMILMQVKRTNIVIIDQQLAALEFVKTRYQLAQTGLACTGVSYQRYCFACLNGEIEVCEYGLALIVAKVEILKLDLACQV